MIIIKNVENIVLCGVSAWDGCLVAACISSTLQEYNSNSYAISDACYVATIKIATYL